MRWPARPKRALHGTLSTTLLATPRPRGLASLDKDSVRLTDRESIPTRTERGSSKLPTDDLPSEGDTAIAVDSATALWVFFGLLGLMAAGFLAYQLSEDTAPAIGSGGRR